MKEVLLNTLHTVLAFLFGGAVALLVALFVYEVTTEKGKRGGDPARLAAGESKEIVCFSSVPLRYKVKDESQLPFRYRLVGDTLYIDGGDLGHSITKLSPGTVCFFDASVQEEQREPERDTSKDRGA